LEESREAAVLAALAQRLGAAEAAARQHAAAALVDKYTRRAVLGALAAVAPGSDLVIQGVLASGLLRELAALHGVPVREIDLDAFLARAALTVRTATTVLLAIAGNALKAFPGLGTLGGGVVHAIAYGLVFDSLGRAVADTLATQHRLDADHAAAGLRERLGEAARERLRHVAALALREGDDTAAP
ncbi:MAG TPA: GTP-binding protein HSR1, partial [Rhodanobacteraceae bacterium]|nr:GTP-binding protein HSR1 [Rhodanobacteraceae bacterium]